MPSLSRKIPLPGKSDQELYDVVAREIDRFMAKASIGKYEIERLPDQKCVKIKSSLISATLQCQTGQISLDAQLSLLAAPFKSKIDDGIQWWLSKAFPKTEA